MKHGTTASDEFYLVRNPSGRTGDYVMVSGPHTHAEAKQLMRDSEEPVSLIQGSHPQCPKETA